VLNFQKLVYSFDFIHFVIFLFLFLLRLTNGSTLTHIFGVKEQLASIRLYIEMNRTDVDKAGSNPFKLQTNFPRHIFTEEEYEKPLDSLGLVPSAVLIVSRI